MSPRIKADGDTWKVEIGDEGGGRVAVFFCTSTDQRPYRVVELDADRYADEAALDEASEEDLHALFEASRSMGAPRSYPTYER
ncbi:MAG: hypothetical protein MJB57_14875 [Gemmatimonadetes bacterium]|nr:hypothetical protein [Gemmatimonadota bacterium]